MSKSADKQQLRFTAAAPLYIDAAISGQHWRILTLVRHSHEIGIPRPAGHRVVTIMTPTEISETIQCSERILEQNRNLRLEMTRSKVLLREKRAVLRRFPSIAARLKADADAACAIQPDVVYAQRKARTMPDNAEHIGCVRLRIDFGGGLPLNDYRVRGGLLEFRVLDSQGHPHVDGNSDWRVVDMNQIALHYALGTVVSKWLRVRLGDNGEDTLDRAA